MNRLCKSSMGASATAVLGFLSMMALLGLQTAACAAAGESATAAPWWQNAVIYEIYPRSFQDSDGDGVGDLNGITQRLDYLRDLGVDAIWITPMYPSPQVDFGYDIADYENVDSTYGSLADFDRLVAAAKQRHIRVVLDMVLNHTSDKHPWFIESSRSKASPKHDWYVWRDGKTDADGKRLPPNNWQSVFGHSAWQYDAKLDQFYYHKFYLQQPDLNWRNPSVERAMFGAMRFWLNRGVAGFRLDAIPTLFEDPDLRDERELPGTNAFGDPNLAEERTSNLPEVHEVIRRLRNMTDRYAGDRVLIGETYLPNIRDLDRWYGGAKHDELQLPMDMNVGFGNKLDARTFRARIDEVETQIHGSEPLLVFDNHDNPRSWDRYGDGVNDALIAKQIAALLLTTRGTALLYYGEELGMRTSTPQRREDVLDPIGVTGWPKEKGRDGERTPMQWDASNAQAGFSSNAHTWLPVPANYTSINVQTESADPDSLLNWHRRLIALRRTEAALRSGNLLVLDQNNAAVFSYVRVGADGQAVVVALNMSAQPQTISLDLAAAGARAATVKTLLASDDRLLAVRSSTALTLPPFASWMAAVGR
ncbi:MAG: alpha-glucosidase [Steroidobacteraceae bacterium]|jgi:alpha-glucosidase